MKGKISFIAISIAIMVNMTANAKNVDKQLVGAEQLYGTQVAFSAKANAKNTTVSIIGPDGFHAHKFAPQGIPTIDLLSYGKLKNGLYQYEITSAVGKRVLIKDKLNNGRGEKNSHYARKGITQSGHFRVEGGSIKRYKNIKEVSGKSDF
ncbi:MAG: hypothetical protein ACI8WB_005268 [Phenylobacterium sp.]|jgi:hypothetical protein